MIVSIARNYYWTPDEIEKLFVDSIDYKGLVFWYDDALEMQREINKSNNSK